jgi:hypothetical protein
LSVEIHWHLIEPPRHHRRDHTRPTTQTQTQTQTRRRDTAYLPRRHVRKDLVQLSSISSHANPVSTATQTPICVFLYSHYIALHVPFPCSLPSLPPTHAYPRSGSKSRQAVRQLLRNQPSFPPSLQSQDSRKPVGRGGMPEGRGPVGRGKPPVGRGPVGRGKPPVGSGPVGRGKPPVGRGKPPAGIEKPPVGRAVWRTLVSALVVEGLGERTEAGGEAGEAAGGDGYVTLACCAR